MYNPLHTAFILNLLTHDLHTDLVSGVNNLPKDVYTNLIQLAELAARGLEERRFIFNDVPYSKLGLMVSVRKLYNIRPNQPVSYTFLHLTVQEYLAALYWSRYPADQQPKRFLDSQIIKYLSFNSLNSSQHEKHRPFCLFFAGLANIKDYVDLNKINKTIFIDNKYFAIPQMCELLFEAQSTDPFSSSSFKMPNSDFYYDHMNILSAPLESFTLAYCFIKNSVNTTTWSFTIMEKGQLQQLADGMHSISSPDWDERNGPIVRMHLTRNVNDILEVFPSLYPFTKSITVLNLSGDLNDKGADIMKKLSYYCPRLTSLRSLLETALDHL